MPLDFFGKTKLPNNLPSEMEEIIRQLRCAENKEDCLRKVYDILLERYRGYRYKTYFFILGVFRKKTEKLWRETGFMHCTNINYLARILLVKSGKFSEDEIRIKWTLIWFVSPHQFLQVNIGNKWIDIDIWARTYGIEYGDHAHGFH